ncbi:MAG TPA: preprotein translocase subunit SecG [Candidatus Marinimicrobia bacterium]|nr:preprotein translocase subunit SecG [Candidatus Neomarinimicrobiota bacterium]
MYAFLVFLFLVVSLLLIVSILMQNSKGTGLAGTFGGIGGANTVFGGRSAASFLAKATTYLAIAFFVLTIMINLTIRSRTNVESVVKKQAAERMVTPSSALPAPQGVQIDRPVIQPEEGKKQ